MPSKYTRTRKKLYPDGGKIKKDLYGTPIESNIINNPSVNRSYYDSRLDQIVLGTDYDNELDQEYKDKIIAHENYHAGQYKNDRSTVLPVKDIPYKKPSMASTDEVYYGYHNRKPTEAQNAINELKKNNPGFKPVPDDIIYNNIVDAAQYYDMSTMEGEAKLYEDLGADISKPQYRNGGRMYPDGGKKTPIPIEVSSRNDPRLKAYNDSLSLYNTTKPFLDEISKQNRSGVYDQNVISQLQSNNLGFFKSNPLYDKQGNIIGKSLKSKVDIKGIYPVDYVDVQAGPQPWRVGKYKKPVQPVIYKKPDPSPDLPSGENLRRKNYIPISQEEQELKLTPIPKQKAYINRGANSGFDANGNPLVGEYNLGDNKGWIKASEEELNNYEQIKAYGGTMKKFKKKYVLGGNTAASVGHASGTTGGIDQAGAMDTVGSAAGSIPGIGTAVATGMKLNNLQADLGNTFMMNHTEEPYKDFMAQEQQRGKWMNSINPAAAMMYRTIGAKGRLKNYQAGLDQKEIMDGQQMAIANDYSGYAQDARVTFAGGGNMGTNVDQGLVEFEGPSHEQGGVTLSPEAEVEGRETKKGNYIFSDRLIIPGKKTTFANMSKKFKKLYTDKRPNDPISKSAEERELANLEQVQEQVRSTIIDKAYKKAYGGFLKKKMYAGGSFPNDPNDILSQLERRDETANRYGYTNERASKPNLSQYAEPTDLKIYPTVEPDFGTNLYRQPYPDFNANADYPELTASLQPTTPIKQVPSKNFGTEGLNISGDTVSYNPDLFDNPNMSVNPQDTMSDQEWKDSASNQVGNLQTQKDMSNSKFGMQPEDYASVGVQALSGLSQLYYGLKGPDKVRDAKFNLIRPNKINLTAAKRLGSQEIDTAFSGVDYDVRGNATSTGNYLGNRLASGVKRARSKGELLGRLGMEEANANAQIMNSVGSANAQILNQQEQINLGQEDKRIQEKDASRMAVTEGLNNVGQSFGQGVKDRRSYDMQRLKANWVGTKDIKTDEYGNKYYVLSNGQRKYEEV